MKNKNVKNVVAPVVNTNTEQEVTVMTDAQMLKDALARIEKLEKELAARPAPRSRKIVERYKVINPGKTVAGLPNQANVVLKALRNAKPSKDDGTISRDEWALQAVADGLVTTQGPEHICVYYKKQLESHGLLEVVK